MKNLNFLILILALLSFGCEKDDIVSKNNIDNLKSESEGTLVLKSFKQIYTDDNNNEYQTFSFNNEKLNYTYGVFMEKDKKYSLSISGENYTSVDFLLLKSNNDTLFRGEYDGISQRKYITWTSAVTDTFYIVLKYVDDINFHTYHYHLTFEELSTKPLKYNNLEFMCSGDWFIDKEGSLSIICHQTNLNKWAKINNDSINNYQFSYTVGQSTGKPDNYIGIECLASKDISDMHNLAKSGYVLDVIGPSSWRFSQYNLDGSVAFGYGNTSHNLKIGVGSWNNYSLKTQNDSLIYSINGEVVLRKRNMLFMDNGLYITVDDTKKDTIRFKNIKLVK